MKKGIIFLIILAALASLAIVACSKGARSSASGTSTPKLTKNSIVEAESALGSLETPEGVDSGLFDELKSRFMRDLEARLEGRLVSQAGIQTPPLYLSKQINGDETTTYEWRYFNTGDYDLSGEVGVSDITPIALNYLAETDDGVNDNVQSFIDGDGDGVIGISDITPIALNYLNTYAVSVAFFDVRPEEGWSLSQWESSALFSVGAGLNPAPGATLPLTINLNATDEHYGWVGLTFNDADIPQHEGTYYFGVRTAGDPPRFVSYQEYTITGEPGEAPIVESVSPQYGYPYEPTKFVAEISAGTEPLEFFWNFGGGAVPNTTLDRSPDVTLYREGTYNSSVKVSNEYGTQVFEFVLEISNKPKITAISPIGGGYSGDEITFNATVGGEEPFTYAWDFGGGAEPDTSDEPSPTVTLGEPGDYSAKLVVSSPFGSDQYNWTLKVSSGAPKISNVSPLTGMASTMLNISASVSGLLPISYLWMFGSAAFPESSTSSNPQIQLASVAGVYPCSLTITNDNGSDYFEFELTVTSEPVPPFVNSVSPMSGQSGAAVEFTADVTGTPPIIYTWNFGGGATPNESGQISPTVTLGSAGTYQASLFVENSFGLGSHLYEFNLVVSPAPGQWTNETVQSGSNMVVGSYARLIFLNTGEPFIAYQAQTSATTREVRTALKAGDEWQIELVDDAGGGSTGYELDMTLDPDGNPTLVYQLQTGPPPDSEIKFDLIAAFYDGQDWTFELPDDDTDPGYQNGHSAGIHYASDGRCFVHHYKYLDLLTPHWARSVVKELDGNWSHETVTTLPRNLRAVLDGNDDHVFFVRKEDGLYSYWGGSQTTIVSGSENGYWISMDKDENGFPAATWYDFNNEDLYFCRWNGAAWTSPEIVRSLGNVGVHSSLKFAPDGKPWVAYHNVSQGTLMVSYKGTGNWITFTVDGGGGISVGRYPSLAFNQEGKPCVAYLQNTNGNFAIKYAELN